MGIALVAISIQNYRKENDCDTKTIDGSLPDLRRENQLVTSSGTVLELLDPGQATPRTVIYAEPTRTNTYAKGTDR